MATIATVVVVVVTVVVVTGHACSLQASTSVRSPKQGSPPKLGLGLVHALVFVFVPPPQVDVHVDGLENHSDQPPSTVTKRCALKRLTIARHLALRTCPFDRPMYKAGPYSVRKQNNSYTNLSKGQFIGA